MAINVLVAVEVRDGELKKSGREGLGLARKLVDQAGGGRSGRRDGGRLSR